jgi:hypothetical protein
VQVGNFYSAPNVTMALAIALLGESLTSGSVTQMAEARPSGEEPLLILQI